MMIQEINIKNSIIINSSTVREAIAAIDNTLARTAIVIDEYRKVVGTITDGDVRRHLIGAGNLSDQASFIMNKEFIYRSMSSSDKSCVEIMLAHNIRQLPILNDHQNLEKLYILKSQYQHSDHKLNTVVIMAGGKGNRLRPMTLDMPKPLIKVGDQSMIEIVIENSKMFGLTNFIICVNYLKDQIIDTLGNGDKLGVNIKYVEEQQELGTAGALSLISDEVNKPLLIMNADVLTKVHLRELLEFHDNKGADITICSRYHYTQVPFGVIEATEGKVTSIVEKPEYMSEVNAGIYVISPKLLTEIEYNKYLDMPDFIQMLLKQNKTVCTFPIHEYWIDVGQHHSLETARREWNVS
jgi:dTDP-glucose pyrophosphorylase